LLRLGSEVGFQNEKAEVTQVTEAIFDLSRPSAAEATLAREANRVLAAKLREEKPLRLCISDEPSPEGTFNLPVSVLRLLVRILEEIARDNAISLIPVRTEHTTQEAADILNISRPSLIQLLEEGKIEFRRVGTQRRVRFEALLEYTRQVDTERREVLKLLAAFD
jgi:excisionase family DNA binding protein